MRRVAATGFRERRVAVALFRESGVRSAMFRERRVAVALFRESGVRSAIFREQALSHCTTLLRGQR